MKRWPLDARDSCRYQLTTAGVTCSRRAQDHAGQNSSMDPGRSSPRPHTCWQLMVAEGVRVTLFRGCGCWHVAHGPEGGHTPIHIWEALTGL